VKFKELSSKDLVETFIMSINSWHGRPKLDHPRANARAKELAIEFEELKLEILARLEPSDALRTLLS
jgi:hypothetical protein